jgi:hypothetical protein
MKLTPVKMWFCQQDAEFYSDRLMDLPEFWEECVDHRGDCVEK